MLRTLIFLLLLTCCSQAQSIGRVQPNFQFQNLEGETVSLDSLVDQSQSGLVLMTFWCTSCSSCRAGEQHLTSLDKKYGKKAKIVAIASSRYDKPEKIKKFLKANNLKIKVLMDPESAMGHHYGVERTTTTVTVDKKRQLRYYGTLLRRKKYYARDSLSALLSGKIVGKPMGPTFG